MNRKFMVAAGMTVGLSFLLGTIINSNLLAQAQGMGGNVASSVTSSQTSGNSINTITVTGDASMAVTNVINQLQINYNITDSTVSAVMKDEQSLVTRLKNKLRQLGVSPSNYQLYFNSVNVGNQMPSANLSLNVETKSNTEVEKLMENLNIMPNYVNNLYSNLQSVPVNPTVIRAKLFDSALADAKTQATMLAMQVGDKLGPVVTINVNPQENYQPGYGSMPNQPSIGGINLINNGNSGSSELTTQISVTYELMTS